MKSVEKAINKAIGKVDGLDSESASYAVERASIEAALADKKTAYKLLNWPPSRGPMPKHMQKKSKFTPAKVKIETLPEGAPPLVTRKDKTHEYHFNVHVETLAALSLYQADRVVTAYDENGCSGLLLGEKDDFLPRRTGCAECGPVSGKRKKPKTPPTVVVDLRYPLSRVARVTIPPFWWNGPSQSWGAILWAVARAYKQVYKQWKRYGIWGHQLDDLWFEGCAVTSDGRISLHIGS